MKSAAVGLSASVAALDRCEKVECLRALQALTEVQIAIEINLSAGRQDVQAAVFILRWEQTLVI
jgi:hypothetical protein